MELIASSTGIFKWDHNFSKFILLQLVFRHLDFSKFSKQNKMWDRNFFLFVLTMTVASLLQLFPNFMSLHNLMYVLASKKWHLHSLRTFCSSAIAAPRLHVVNHTCNFFFTAIFGVHSILFWTNFVKH